MIARRTWWVLGLFPLVFFAVNRAWMYSVQDFPDAWEYTGYFLHPELLYPRMPEAYQGTRVLHIIVGWLANRWLPTAEAIFAQKAVIFYANWVVLFGLLHRMFRSERAALIGAALGVTNGLMIYLQSWNYVFNTTPVLLTGALWAQARMRDGGRGWWKWAMLAGALYVGGVWTYLPMALAAPMVFALFVYGLPERTWGKLGAGLGWAALGGVLSMVAQGVISVGLGGSFWYFLPQFQRVEGYMQQDWFIPLEYWWLGAVWLVFLGLVLVLAGLAVWKSGGRRGRSWRERLAEPLPMVSAVFILGLLWYWLLDAAHVHQVLQNREQASFLYPLAFLVVGGWVAWLLEGMEAGRQWIVVAVTLGGILLMYGWLGHFWPAKWVVPWTLLLIPVIWGAGMAGAGARPGVALTAALIFAGALAGLNAYLAERRFLSPDAVKSNVAFDEALFGTVRMIDAWDREGEVWFWDGIDRPNGRLHQVLSYFYDWNRQTLGEGFPGLVSGRVGAGTSPAERKFKLQAGQRVLLFDPKPEEMAAAQAGLAERGLQLRPLAQEETPAGGNFVPMRMELWEAEPLKRGGASP